MIKAATKGLTLMCGIAGFYRIRPGANRRELEAAGEAMARALAHRGPDDAGTWQDPDLPLVLAHRRLSIIDLSVEGRQPMVSQSERFCIIYNGEIYNFLDLQQQLEAKGVRFRGRSDTEVMLAAFDHWGVNRALQKFNGMFAFVLWDRKQRQLHLVRDRMGKKPLYVGWAGDALIFGSELKSFHAYPDFHPEISRQALTLFMRYGCVPAPFSIYGNCWQLLPGCRMTLSLEQLSAGENLTDKMEPYWHHPRIVEEARQRTMPQSDDEAISAFEAHLARAVERRMVSDVPLGAFLSGGIDSSAIVALMRAHAPNNVQTFSIGFKEKGYDEAGYAKKVAAHLGTDHHEHYLSAAQAQDIIPGLATMYDEPFADASQIPTYLVSKFARDNVTVALSGDGGDELLGGYVRHLAAPALWKKIGLLPRPVRAAMAGAIRALPTETWDRLFSARPQFGEKLYKAAEIMPLAGPEEIYRKLVSVFDDPAALVINGEEPPVPLTREDWQPRGLGFAGRMMYGDALSYLPNDVLTKVDRASMAVSLEVRAPFLDKDLFEYVWSLPQDMKIRNGQGKWLLRQVLARYLPEDLFERPKQGFAVPVGEWIRGPLKDWAEDLLSPERLIREGYLDHEKVQAIWRDHLEGRGRHADQLWAILMFESWLARWHS